MSGWDQLPLQPMGPVLSAADRDLLTGAYGLMVWAVERDARQVRFTN